MDFTIKVYKELLDALIKEEYEFQTFEQFIKAPKKKAVILRHDVDLLPGNSLRFAEIQSEKGLNGTYYFRAVPESWDASIIKKIHSMGHEIGYHYECLTTTNGDMHLALKDFKTNLEALRKLCPVSTICMHGSPASPFDSKDLWSEQDYREFDIIAEPYFDVDFNKVFYLTDTGRMWDGHKVSVRDRVDTEFTLTFHTTKEIISALGMGLLPKQIMFTFHPQRWHDQAIPYVKEFLLQNAKNVVKKNLIRYKNFKN